MDCNIYTVKLYDVIVPTPSDGDISEVNDLFMVMDFVDYSLKGILTNKEVPFSEDHALVILYNLTCSMKFIHSAGLIHRDLKPGNILIDSECCVKICDFGLTRSIPEELEVIQDYYSNGFSDDTTPMTHDGSPDSQDKSPKMTTPNGLKETKSIRELGTASPILCSDAESTMEKRYSTAERLSDDSKDRATRVRQLSSQVTTRFYRAPEIIV